EKAVMLKENRLSVLSGLNRLDDIARRGSETGGIADDVGDWLAEHINWLSGNEIQPVDADRIKTILGSISQELELNSHESKVSQKIQSEIDRWRSKLTVEANKETITPVPGQKMVLHRGPESAESPDRGTVDVFTKQLKSLLELWEGVSDRRPHILTALDDLLKSAYLQQNQEALLLSGFVIYYLRQNGYIVEPYVKRLKAAESLIKKGGKTD
ncbi:MAG: hypothetical protein ACREBV_01590, partial [Candidatus Zixiibacteriota bacterium]